MGRTADGPPVRTEREAGLSVLAIGDWGGTSLEPYYTDVEERNAFAMAGVAESVLDETGSPAIVCLVSFALSKRTSSLQQG